MFFSPIDLNYICRFSDDVHVSDLGAKRLEENWFGQPATARILFVTAAPLPMEFSSDGRTMSMQMIGRRSISVRSEFSCGSRCAEGADSALFLSSASASLIPLVDKRGPAPVDNGSMALRMQAQDSALFEFVAFCLSSATVLFSRPLPVTYRFWLLGSSVWKPYPLADAVRNLQSPIRRTVLAYRISFAFFCCLLRELFRAPT